ncbi:hypothetical protein scyTo_0023017 [Scyliorhinus torazame]|uniref:Uncharacterized protein n=1 Tax=Scyliorhinus torazame TaxID=75743 RepID=A0A401Q8J1_SCYTO|nr:hypothetical protein [Scyliorhinus torazame]
MHTSKSFSSALPQPLSSGESVPGSPTLSLSPGPATPWQTPAPELQSGTNSPLSTSPGSSAPTSPAGSVRPCTLHGLGPKPGNQRYKAGRRKSINSIPPSPLACTSSPTPQVPSPHRSPSPLPGYSKNIQAYPGKMLSPPTTVRHSIRVRAGDSPRSPLLKRVQSAEKLSAVYLADKKQSSSGKHAATSSGEGINETLQKECRNLGEVGEDQTLPDGQGPGENVGHDHVGTQKLRESTAEGHESDQDRVVMKKLIWSERRDSFKKQEAVQEVGVDAADVTTVAGEWERTKKDGGREGADRIEEKCSEHKAAWGKGIFGSDATSEEDSDLKEPSSLKSVPQIEVHKSGVESHQRGAVEWTCHVTSPIQGLCHDPVGQFSTGGSEMSSMRKQRAPTLRPEGQVLHTEVETLGAVHHPHQSDLPCCHGKTQTSLWTEGSPTQTGHHGKEAPTRSRESAMCTDTKLQSQSGKQEAHEDNTIASSSPAKKSTRNRKKGRVKD